MTDRDWRLRASPKIQTCTFCGRSITPHEMFYRDVVSGHLNAHRGCLDESVSGERSKGNP